MLSDIVKSTNKTWLKIFNRSSPEEISFTEDEFEYKDNIFIKPKLTIKNFYERHLNNPMLGHFSYDKETKLLKTDYLEVKNDYGGKIIYSYYFTHELKDDEFKLMKLKIKTRLI